MIDSKEKKDVRQTQEFLVRQWRAGMKLIYRPSYRDAIDPLAWSGPTQSVLRLGRFRIVGRLADLLADQLYEYWVEPKQCWL